MNRFTSAVLCFIFLLSYTATAQNNNITGTIKDNTDKPISDVTVSLLQANDSSWVQSELSATDGTFRFKNIVAGKYIIDARTPGYLLQLVDVNENIDKALVIVLQKQNNLKEVTVSAKKPLIEFALGKTIVNTDASILNKGSNALDLLRRSPGVVVDFNGNISLDGKQGIIVLIDDRPTYLTGKDLIDYLKGMSSDEVSQLELITQPSSKYDAEGAGGIINLKTKKSKKQGFYGMASVSYSQGVYQDNYNYLQLNYRKNKLNLFANANYFEAGNFADWHENECFYDSITHQPDHTVALHSNPMEVFSNARIRLGADYNLTDKTSFGASFTGNYHPNHMHDDIITSTTDYVHNDTSYNDRQISEGFIRKDANANLYLKHQFNKESDLNINLDYLYYNRNEHQDINSADYNSQMIATAAPQLLRSTLPTIINVYSFKTDYTTKLKGNIVLDAGVKSSFVSTDNVSDYQLLQNNIWIPDTTRSNHFLYKENINAVYLNLHKKFGEKYEAQLGLRGEQTYAQGKQYVHDQNFIKNYTALFPTAFVSYTLNKDNQFEINYARRLTRPGYRDLNPFVYYTFQYNYFVGNPYLLPEYTNSFELRHIYKHLLSTKLYYSHTSNMINDVYLKNDTTGVLYYTRVNAGTNNNYGVSVNITEQVYKWWQLNFSGNARYADFISFFNNQHIDVSGTFYSLNINTQFSFIKGWTAEGRCNYTGPYQGSFMSSVGPLIDSEVAVTKKLWNDTAVMKLSVSDPFYVYEFTGKDNSANFNTNTSYKYNSRLVGLSFTYNIGKKIADNKQHDITMPDESNRIN